MIVSIGTEIRIITCYCDNSNFIIEAITHFGIISWWPVSGDTKMVLTSDRYHNVMLWQHVVRAKDVIV